jgi:hypothetical protein
MFLVMADIAERFQVFFFIRPAGCVVFDVVKLQMAGVGGVPFFM